MKSKMDLGCAEVDLALVLIGQLFLMSMWEMVDAVTEFFARKIMTVPLSLILSPQYLATILLFMGVAFAQARNSGSCALT